MTYHHSSPLSLLSSLTTTVTFLLLTSLVIVSYNFPSSSSSCYVHAFSIVVPSSLSQQQRRLSNYNVHQHQHQQQDYQNSRIAANDLTSLYNTKGNNKIDVATATAATMMSLFLFVLNVGNVNAIDIDDGTTFSSSSIQISEQIKTLDMGLPSYNDISDAKKGVSNVARNKDTKFTSSSGGILDNTYSGKEAMKEAMKEKVSDDSNSGGDNPFVLTKSRPMKDQSKTTKVTPTVTAKTATTTATTAPTKTETPSPPPPSPTPTPSPPKGPTVVASPKEQQQSPPKEKQQQQPVVIEKNTPTNEKKVKATTPAPPPPPTPEKIKNKTFKEEMDIKNSANSIDSNLDLMDLNMPSYSDTTKTRGKSVFSL